MSESTAKVEEPISVSGFSPHHLAWGVILIAFAVFSMICAGTTMALHHFLFQSSLNMSSVIQVGSGTVGVKYPGSVEQAETSTREISSDATIRTTPTDFWSQAVISFRDAGNEEMLVAAVTLKSATTVTLQSAIRPRFEWSSNNYRIELVDLSGEVDIRIAETVNRPVELHIRTPEDVEVRLTAGGDYVIHATDTEVRVANYQGEAILIASDRSTANSIPVGEEGIIVIDTQTIARRPAMTNLIENNRLVTTSPETAEVTNGLADPPLNWSCFTGPPENLPSGRYRADVAPDGRRSFRLVRAEGADTMGYTRCEQSLGTSRAGVDVTGYDQLFLQATLYIDYQSLSLCGIDASECPLMLVVRFIDVNGNAREWIHGIYARLDPGTIYRRRCDTCLDNHLQIYEKTWYIYNSENLFALFQEQQRPAIVTDVVFYASGHQYNVYVDEVSLMARAEDLGINAEATASQ